MLLGFKRRFAPFVEDGSKTHTIRAIRKIVPRVGEMCHCYVDPRQKSMRLLGRWPCVRVQEIEMHWLAIDINGRDCMTVLIRIDGVELSPEEANLFAWRDGFRSRTPETALGELHDYWHKLHGHAAFPFHGHLIHWSRNA